MTQIAVEAAAAASTSAGPSKVPREKRVLEPSEGQSSRSPQPSKRARVAQDAAIREAFMTDLVAFLKKQGGWGA